MSKTPSKKRAVEEDSEPMQDDDSDEHTEEEMVTSPSPAAKKDMQLRSGRRKRRRSKETSGLTPTEKEKVAKKARKNNVNDSEEEDDDDDDEEEQILEANGRVMTSSPNEMGVATTPVNGNDSAKFTDAEAVASAQDPEMETTLESAVSPVDANRRLLFDSKPPRMPAAVTTATDNKTAETSSPMPQHGAPRQRVESATTTTSQPPVNGGEPHDDEEEMIDISHKGGLPFRVFFMVLLSMLFFTIWPFCVQLADIIIPLNELPVVHNETVLLYSDEEPEVKVVEEIEEVIIEVEEEEEGEAVGEITASILEGLERLKTLQATSNESQQAITQEYKGLKKFIDMIKMQINVRETKLKMGSNRLSEAETALIAALSEGDLSATVWAEARQAVEALGKKVLDTSSVQLWEVPEPGECPKVVTEEVKVEESNPLLLPDVLEAEFGNLLLRARMSADKLMNSPVSEEKVREWIRTQIQSSLDGNELASNAIADLASSSEDTGMTDLEELNEAIMERFEMELADRTGEYDHSSIMSGAKVIYGGKRGTSKSLVDYLPIYNRLMQLSQLRFYGYGPEAAITPTYPLDALGQCWSFQQTPLKEQLKQRRRSTGSISNDDHKRGNFGTLTISLPYPVSVASVVLEHPPKGLTDQVTSAVRAFRIIGYGDPMAAGKSWSLGSFTYDINQKNPLQEFEVARDIFSTPVPPLQSITLAIDSNWGFDYACLYRFRVHGEEVDPLDDLPTGQ